MDGSTVSLAWGIQLETIPLLLAIESYEQSAPARLFFSLLHLRARSSTLSFSSSSRRTIASLPPEIVNEILDHLFLALLPDARDAIIKSEGRCDCQREYSTQHTCGVDCSSWFYCCPPDDENQPEGDWNRMKTFRTKLHHFHIPKVLPVCSSLFSFVHLAADLSLSFFPFLLIFSPYRSPPSSVTSTSNSSLLLHYQDAPSSSPTSSPESPSSSPLLLLLRLPPSTATTKPSPTPPSPARSLSSEPRILLVHGTPRRCQASLADHLRSNSPLRSRSCSRDSLKLCISLGVSWSTRN
ncbi:hypothetical protein BDY24DRAFT_382188 [Mrakia frigida]|uniref:uncharacterized protein n=1 Tax=Mrakia frigida TaxID=29902 RepID=UPI003FCC03D7